MRSRLLPLLSVLPVLFVSAVGVCANPFQQNPGPDGIVSIEAEHFDKNTPQGGHTWTLVTAPTGFTGQGAMQALPDSGTNNNDNYITNSPRLDYEINFVKTGTVYVWVRAYGPDGSGDSCHSGLDGQKIAMADRISSFGTAYTWTNTAYQDPERIMFDVPTLGKHTFNIWMREDGAIVDKIVLTTNPNYQPTGEGPVESKRGLPVLAAGPAPETGVTDVLRDVTLAWEASKFAETHDVYFGTAFTDVNTASRTDKKGVLVGQGQAGTTFDPAGNLAFGTTYYWRVDEVNKAPDNTIFKGDVWSFTVEPYGYPVAPVAATASSSQAGMGPEKTIDGSGMTGDLHGTDGTTMWLSTGAQPNWIQYEFDKVYKLADLTVWNSNGEVESFIGFGARNVTIETSTDGATWTPIANVPEFSQAPGAAGYAANTTVNLGDVEAKFVKLTIDATWGGLGSVTGLSEVRFSYAPMQARMPQPADNSGGIAVDADLAWRPGRDVTSHQVFFGTDPAAVASGTAPSQTATEHGFDPGALDFGSFYYWRVDEIGTATYPGNVWSFTTLPYQSVDDFESYTDKAGEEIFTIWVDGMVNSNGSLVGYMTAAGGTFGETTIVHGGKQSMPFEYNNIKPPYYSEAERTFDQAQDWTGNGADALVLYFLGNPAAFAETAGTITMSGSGTDIWNTTDEFRFAFKPLTGDGTIVAKVESVRNTDPWAKCGVMIRESLDPGSRFAAVYATPGNGVRFQARTLNAGSATSDTSVATPEQMALQTPVWIKVERKGSSFSCFYSTDGVAWTTMSWNPQTINMTAATVYIGLAVTSHNATATTTGVFSNVSTTGNVTGAWQVQAIGVAQPANDAGPLYLVVQDSAGKSTVITHPDPAATTLATWQTWKIPLSDLSAGGVKLTAVKKLTVGVGDRANPKPGGAGMLYFDDISFGKPIQWVAQPGEILLEAEAVASITAPMAISDDPLASGGKYIGAPTTQADSTSNPPTTGIAQIPFTVPGGKYKLRFRVVIPGDNNSFWVRIADGTTQTTNHASGWVRFNEIATGDTWHWADVYSSDDGDQVVEWTLAPGAHTLEIAYREAGAQVDVIVIQLLN